MLIITHLYIYFLKLIFLLSRMSNALDTDSVVSEPGAKYILLTDVVPVDDCRYKFHTRSGSYPGSCSSCAPLDVSIHLLMCSHSCLPPTLL